MSGRNSGYCLKNSMQRQHGWCCCLIAVQYLHTADCYSQCSLRSSDMPMRHTLTNWLHSGKRVSMRFPDTSSLLVELAGCPPGHSSWCCHIDCSATSCQLSPCLNAFSRSASEGKVVEVDMIQGPSGQRDESSSRLSHCLDDIGRMQHSHPPVFTGVLTVPDTQCLQT